MSYADLTRRDANPVKRWLQSRRLEDALRLIPSDAQTVVDFGGGDGAFTEGRPVDSGVTTSPTDTPVGANGNNVDLRKETMAALQSQFQYQILTRAVNDKFSLIKTAAMGQ